MFSSLSQKKNGWGGSMGVFPYEYCSTYHDLIAKTNSGVCYLHLGSILSNCTNIDISLGLHLYNEILINKNVNWHILSE